MANIIEYAPQTPTVWTDSGGDAVMDLGGLAADGVRVGARVDLGAASIPRLYHWRFKCDGFDTSPVVGETIGIYLAGSDGTIEDGEVGTADAAGTTVSLPNLMRIGTAKVQTTTAGDNLQVSSIEPIEISARYVSPVIHNDTADALLSTADDHQFILTPVPPEIQ